MNIQLDLDSYPIILQGFPRGRKAESDLASLFDQMAIVGHRAAENGIRHVVVAVGDEDFTAPERKLIADRMAKAPPAVAACVVGAFAVIESAFARGILTALRWLAPRAIPVVAARTPDEAITLAEACLRANGTEPPVEVVERARSRARQLHAEMRGATLAKGQSA